MTSATLPRILIVDDDPRICASIAAALQGSFETEFCPNAESALVKAQGKRPFDAAITDFILPGMSGLEFIAQARANAKTAHLPLLLITDQVRYAVEGRARIAGANAFLYKPFTPQQLLYAVERLLPATAEHSAEKELS
jgi:two-component system, sensor histidine kinase ChiS